MRILADATIPYLTESFAKHFTVTTYSTQGQLPNLLGQHDILICRSTLKVTAALLENTAIQCVATASSGIDHIDTYYLNKQGILLFDAKGSNASAVADYVTACLALLEHQQHLKGNKAGVIGVGKTGAQVVKRLQAAGYYVLCYDPLKARQDNTRTYCRWDELFSCDLLCIHANLHDTAPYPSKNLLDKDFFSRLKPDTCIINAARGGIINEDHLLSTHTSIIYCADVYCNEPMVDDRIIHFARLCTPHIAGHSIEAKIAAVKQLSQQLHRHYGLPLPLLPLAQPTTQPLLPQSSWQESILNLYNPLLETQELKRAPDKKSTFIALRQAHQHRHNFNYYDPSQLDQYTQSLLG